MRSLWTIYVLLRRCLGRVASLLSLPRWARELGAG
jgi:hypothetical protein